MNFGALLATHLRMNHELGAVNQQHYAENEQETKVLRVRRVVWKPDVVTRSFSTFARVLATKATNVWRQVKSKTFESTPMLVLLIYTYGVS